MPKVLFVIAQNGFRDEELSEPLEELKKAGMETVIASRRAGACSGILGGIATAALALKDAKEKDFDCLVFVGGGGAKDYFDDSIALSLAKEFASAGKVVAAICIAPVILANAGLLNGKKATVFSSEKAALEEKGCRVSGDAVVVDGKIVTASGPKAAREFGKRIAELMVP